MTKTLKQIKQAAPHIASEKVEVLAEELDRIQALKKLWNSDGGKALLQRLKANCATSMRQLQASLSNPTLEALVGLVAKYDANMSLLAELQDITLEEEITRQLEEAVKEATMVG